MGKVLEELMITPFEDDVLRMKVKNKNNNHDRCALIFIIMKNS